MRGSARSKDLLRSHPGAGSPEDVIEEVEAEQPHGDGHEDFQGNIPAPPELLTFARIDQERAWEASGCQKGGSACPTVSQRGLCLPRGVTKGRACLTDYKRGCRPPGSRQRAVGTAVWQHLGRLQPQPLPQQECWKSHDCGLRRSLWICIVDLCW